MNNTTNTIEYEIRVERYLGLGIKAIFPEFTITENNGNTLLHGFLPDQAALHGVLARIRDLGLVLISLTRITDVS
jgi:hypothetical protein